MPVEYRLFEGIDGPGSQTVDAGTYSLGVEFSVTAPAYLTKIHFWSSGAQSGSDHAVRLYEVISGSTGTLVPAASTALPSPLQAGWNTVTLPTPVLLIGAPQRYRAAVYFTADDGYTATGAYWSSGAGAAGITSGLLVAPNSTDATSGHQGSFTSGSDAYPGSSFNAANYWVDVTVQPLGAEHVTTASATVTASADVADAQAVRRVWVVADPWPAYKRRAWVDQAFIASGVIEQDTTTAAVTAVTTSAATATAARSDTAAVTAGATTAAVTVAASRLDTAAVTASTTAAVTATGDTGSAVAAGITCTITAAASVTSPAAVSGSTTAAAVAAASATGGPSRTQLPTATPTRDGLSPTFVTANAAGDYFANDGRTILCLRNTGGSARTVTVRLSGARDSIDLDVTGATIAVPAGAEIMTGSWKVADYRRDDGTTWIDYDSTTSLSVCVLSV